MVTRNDFIKRLAENMETTQKGAKICLDSVLNTLTECLAEGEEVRLNGFGVFKIIAIKEKVSTHPKTGAKICIPAHKKVVFRNGKALKELTE